MRYLLITYLKKADGAIDEQIQVSKTVKDRDTQTCNIILDFKEKKIVKAVVDGQVIQSDWVTIEAYYQQVYPDLIEDLQKDPDTQ